MGLVSKEHIQHAAAVPCCKQYPCEHDDNLTHASELAYNDTLCIFVRTPDEQNAIPAVSRSKVFLSAKGSGQSKGVPAA